MSKAERDNRYLKNRREKSLCGRGGCGRKSGDAFYCATHAKESAERQQRIRDARRALKAAA